MQSYNHQAFQFPRSPHHAASLDVSPAQFNPSPRPRRTSAVDPSPPYISQAMVNQSLIPPSLTPGQQRTKIRDNSVPRRPRTSHGRTPSPYSSPQPSSLYGDYFVSQPRTCLSPAPPLPKKPQALLKPLTNPFPPIPPKPQALALSPASRIPLYPTSIPLSMATSSPQPSETIAPEAILSPDEKEVELVLALSASEARRREEDLIAMEEEELARALEESRLMSDTVYTLDEPLPSPSPSDRVSFSVTKTPAHPPEGESWLHLITPTTSTSSQGSCMNDDPPSRSHSSVGQDGPDSEPGDLSRRPSEVQSLQTAWDASSPAPSLYANVVSNLVRNTSTQSTIIASSSSATSATHAQSDHVPSSDRACTSPSLTLSSRSSGSEQSSLMPSFVSRPSWTSVSSETSSSAGHTLNNEFSGASSGYKSPTQPSPSPDLSSTPLTNLDSLNERNEQEAGPEPGPSARSPVPLSANQYVERDMLMGVSLGFTLPAISTELSPMTGPMPNVITLPYGKAPVFHFQAPSWRKLLKLMARLSATRVEPTVDAISNAKHDLKLRTVIQFVKVHHSASEWRTMLYLTTDYPLPCNIPNSHKYTNGDVSILPYSYTLSPLPTLLRDSSESSMAKYYVVPSTPTTPYPNLPIDFPNLAMYLQSAVQDSRRAANDSSSGLRKLAQYIDNCYQSDADRVAPIDQEGASKRGVGGMFKRVIGRRKANSKSSGGNEEIYDLVTPFVPEEWG